VKQVLYTGQEDRVLIDVGSLSNGDVVFVNDNLADSLVATFPDAYSIVEEEAATVSAPVADAPADASAPADAATDTQTSQTKSSSKNSSTSAS